MRPKNPVELEISNPVIHLIGPANDENPNRTRSILEGRVVFADPKIKWQRVTLNFHGRAVLLADHLLVNMGSENAFSEHSRYHEICDVDKELIVSGGEDFIEFGLHLPFDLPPTMRTKHGYVEYTLIARFCAGSFKTAKLQKEVVIKRHYVPNACAVVPTNQLSGCKNWFEWVMEMPRAAMFEQGEVVASVKWSCEKERVEVREVETRLEETEIIRFKSRTSITSLRLPPRVFPSAIYTPPTFTDPLETHYLRTPISPKLTYPHIFSPLIEINHTLHIIFKFTNDVEDLHMAFPIIITDLPEHQPNVVSGGDDAVPIDLGLPEYWEALPRYGELETPKVQTVSKKSVASSSK